MLFCFFKYLIIAIIAAGVTPDILEAAPNVGGCILINFSTISLERLPTSLKFVVFGIINFKTIKTMKKLLITLSLLVSVNPVAQTWGNGEYWISYEYTPKDGKVEAFEKAVKEKTAKWNASPETAIFAFKVVNGQNTGTYERWMTRKDRAFFDIDHSAEIAYWAKNVG